MNKHEHLAVLYSIFAFLQERHPLVLASLLTNSAHSAALKFQYEIWLELQKKNLKEKENDEIVDSST